MASIRTEFVIEADAARVWKTVMHIVEDGEDRCRFVWSRDVLPDELAQPLLAAMREAGPVIKRTLEER